MKICLISSIPIGGFKSFLENIASLLCNNNCEVSVLFLNENYKTNLANVRQLSFKMVINSSNRKSFTMRRLLKKVKYHFKKNLSRDEVLSLQIFRSQIAAADSVLNSKQHIDLTEYDCVISTEEVTCNYFLANNVKARKKIGYIHPDYLMAHFDAKVDKYFLKRLDYICAVSKSNAKSIIRAMPSLERKIIGIPNPIDVEKVIDKSNASFDVTFDDTSVNIITVCRLDNTSKALDRLLEIVKALKERGLQFVWRIVGDGPYRENMYSYIKKHDLSKCLIMMGHLDNPIPLVKRSDLFVLQSYYEGYPMSVCEALIVNTPALITNYASAEEQIKDGITGYIVNNNIDSIYSKLEYIIKNRQELVNLRNNLIDVDKSCYNTIKNLINICSE